MEVPVRGSERRQLSAPSAGPAGDRCEGGTERGEQRAEGQEDWRWAADGREADNQQDGCRPHLAAFRFA
jgi:hypothetical protein